MLAVYFIMQTMLLKQNVSTVSGRRRHFLSFLQCFSLMFWKSVWLHQSSEDNTALGSLHWLFVFYLSKNFPSFNLALALWPSHFYSFILLILSFYFPSLIPFFFPFHKVNCVSHEGYNRLSRISLSIGSTPSTLNINLRVIVLLNVTFIRKMTCV